MLHAIGSLSPSIMYASPRVILLPLTDACVSMGTLVYAYIRVLNPPPGQRDLSRAGLIQY